MSKKEDIQKQEIPIMSKFMGLHAINSFADKDSASRAQMLGQHISQTLPLCDGDPRIIQNGTDMMFSKHTFKRKISCKARIIATIPRYRLGMEKGGVNSITEVIVIYLNLDENKYDHVSLPSYSDMHSYFGFEYKWDEKKLQKLRPGTIIEEETILADSPTVKDGDKYCFGATMNVVSVSHPGVAEDAVIIRRGAIPKLRFKVYEKRAISVSATKVLANLYGDENNYKPLPNIGEKIHSSGMICLSRELDIMSAPILFSKKGLMKYNIMFDEANYSRDSNGVVKDIKIYRNPTSKKAPLTGTTDFLDSYSKALVTFHQEIIDVYEDLEKDGKQLGKSAPTYSPKFHALVVESLGIVYGDGPDGISTPIKKLFKKDPIDLYRVEIVVEHELSINHGYKLTNLHGKLKII